MAKGSSNLGQKTKNKERTWNLIDFTVPVDPQSENKRKKEDGQILGSFQRSEKDAQGDGYTVYC